MPYDSSKSSFCLPSCCMGNNLDKVTWNEFGPMFAAITVSAGSSWESGHIWMMHWCHLMAYVVLFPTTFFFSRTGRTSEALGSWWDRCYIKIQRSQVVGLRIQDQWDLGSNPESGLISKGYVRTLEIGIRMCHHRPSVNGKLRGNCDLMEHASMWLL